MNPGPSDHDQTHATYDEGYTNYQSDRSAFRKFIRKIYLKRAARLTLGPTLDIGCGIGELLPLLPAGSAGLEYNANTVRFCQSQGRRVAFYDGFQDDWTFSGIPWKERFQTLIMSHVLEHFVDPEVVLRSIARNADPAIKRIVAIVPGQAGFKLDPTHRTFIDLPFFERFTSNNQHWKLSQSQYFPFPLRLAGDIFAHNELQIVLERTAMN